MRWREAWSPRRPLGVCHTALSGGQGHRPGLARSPFSTSSIPLHGATTPPGPPLLMCPLLAQPMPSWTPGPCQVSSG